MLVEKEHEGCLQVGWVVVEHLIVLVQIVHQVSNEQQIVGFERGKISDLTPGLFRLFSLDQAAESSLYRLDLLQGGCRLNILVVLLNKLLFVNDLYFFWLDILLESRLI